MSFGSGYGDLPSRADGLLASEADREAAQAVLKTAFTDQRLTQDEFESRVGRACAARTQAELAQLTRDLPAAPSQPAPASRLARRKWLLVSGIAVVALAAFGIVQATSSGAARRAGTAARAPVGHARPAPAPSSGPAGCPVGTSHTALTIANALALDPVYVDPASSVLTGTQARRLQAKIARVDPGRIRVAAVTPSTLRRGGGTRALTNAIANCRADAAGTTLVATSATAYVVTSYANYSGAAQAVQAALNTHAGLAAGLMDAVGRIATVDTGG
jgi:Domain of unknown function (DUF1707)